MIYLCPISTPLAHLLQARAFGVLFFYPVSRSNFLTLLFGADYHQLIKYHKFLATVFVNLCWLHGGTFYLIGLAQGTWFDMAYVYTDGAINLFGSLSLYVLTVVFLCSQAWVRKSYFWVRPVLVKSDSIQVYPIHFQSELDGE